MQLSNKEIKQLRSISDVNSKKSAVQQKIIDIWWKTKIGLVESFTGSGKSVLISKLIQRINKEYPEYNIIIISPTSKLESDFNDRITEYGLKNTTSTTIMSYAKLVKENNKVDVDVLLIDEAHRVANITSELYSEIIPNTNYKFLFACSATFEYNHLKYFQENNIPLIFKFPISDGFKLSIVPENIVHCIGVKLTDKEKLEYIKLQKEYDSYISFFSQYDVNSPISAIMSVTQKKGKKYKYDGHYVTSTEHAKRIADKLEVREGSVVGVGMKWLSCVNRRSTLLNNCENLTKGALYILKNIIKERALVFCSSIENSKYLQKQLENSKCYNSSVAKKTLERTLQAFENNEFQYLLTVKGLDEGYDLPELRFGLQYSYSSKKVQLRQRTGRTNRYDANNIDKVSHFFCLYVDDFEYEEKQFLSPQLKWLKNSLKGTDFVQWETINQIEI